MNILVVNENFTAGGLETHIHSYYMELRDKHHFVFAFGNFKSKLEFDEAEVHTGFHFGWRCSIGEFIDDVERLLQLIREEKIDVIHAHPFHSIFPAVVAGQLSGIPVVCTHHGTYSFAFPGGINEALLLYYAYTELVSCVFSVSQSGKLALERYVHVPNVIFIPNAIDSKLYHHHTVINNHRWAVISRLDADVLQTDTLKQLFTMLPHLPIDNVDIYGDGSQRKDLEAFVRQHDLAGQVHFMGYCADLHNRLDGQYNGIMGSGRVALEGLTMGYPVLEIGYGRICGLLHGDLLQQAKGNNFVANILPKITSDALAAQLEEVYADPKQFDFRQEVVNVCDIRIVAQTYMEQLQSLFVVPHSNIFAWFDAIKDLPNSNTSFYASQDVFQTMVQYIKPYVINQNMLDMFLLGCSRLELSGQFQQLQSSLLGQTQYFEKAKTRLSEIEEVQRQLQAQLSGTGESQRQFQIQLSDLEEVQGQLQAQASRLEETQEQLQTQILDLREKYERLWTEFQEQLQTQARVLEQLQEQTEYHGKILAPLIWLRRFLSRIKWKIKSWLR